jgi:hypothetical protein
MANDILATSPHASNFSCLTSLIYTALQTRYKVGDRSFTDYQQTISTLMGLSLTAILAEGSCIHRCRSHFFTFLRYRHIPKEADKQKQLSKAIAEMVCHAMHPFRSLGYPRYFFDFNSALINVLKSSDTMDGKTEEKIRKMITRLFI